MPEILLIHEGAEVQSVDRLASEIANAGVTVEKFSPGRLQLVDWLELLRVEIDEAKVVIVVWSQGSSQSEVMLQAADLALAKGKLVPLRMHDLDPSAISGRFRQLDTPLVDDWDAIGNAISEKFQTRPAEQIAEPSPPPAPIAQPTAPTASPPAPPAAAAVAAQSVVRESASAAPSSQGTATQPATPVAEAAPTPAPAPAPASAPASAPTPAPAAAAAPAPAAAPPPPAPVRRTEGVGAASDGPSRIDGSWRLEPGLGGDRSGTSVRFDIPRPSLARLEKPAALTFDELQRARGHAQGSHDHRQPADSLSEVRPGSNTIVDDVDCSVFAPPVARVGSRIMVQVFLHLIDQAERAQFLAQTMDDTAKLRGIQTLQLPIRRQTTVAVELDGRGLRTSQPLQRLFWHGQPAVAAFEVEIPKDFNGDVCHPVARVLVDGEPAGRILFQIRIEQATRDAKPSPASELSGTSAKHYQYAFLSYASQDRAEVLKRAQAFQATKLDFFQDVLSLEPGQRYNDEIVKKIDKSDLFVLFWSRHAKRSQWVQKEIEQALACQRASPDGLPDIVPIMLDLIADAPPPPALSHLHMNDPVAYLIASQTPSIWQRIGRMFGR